MTVVWQISERRAGRVLKAPRSTQQYKATRDDQADIKQRIKEIAQTRVRSLSSRRIGHSMPLIQRFDQRAWNESIL